MNNKSILAASFLIIALSIGYYFVIFLPKQDHAKLDLQKQDQEQKVLGAQANKSALNNCLEAANMERFDFWNKNCKNLGLKEDCELSAYRADTVNNAYKEEKDDCFKKYPQK